MVATRPLRVLLIDDDPPDVEMVREAMRVSGVACRLTVLTHGDEVLPLLRGEPPNQSRFLPDLILLDINLPGAGGIGILEAIKSDRELAPTPVVVFTTSRYARDIEVAYRGRANAYICKPIDWASFQRIIAGVTRFWQGVARQPSGGGPQIRVGSPCSSPPPPERAEKQYPRPRTD